MKYTIEEIQQMPEGQTFDCKSIHIEPKHLASIIIAMANADGGVIAVGISDKTRRIEGINQDKAHLNEILRTPLDFVFRQFLSLQSIYHARIPKGVIIVCC